MDWSFTYLALNLFTISYPLARSFENRVHFVGQWRYLLPAIVLTGALFIVWDEWFTQMGVWGFTPAYLTGIYIGSLPLEEWLFFLTVPFACIFIYEVLIYFIPKPPKRLIQLARGASMAVPAVLFVIAGFHLEHIYTLLAFAGAGVMVLIHLSLFPPILQFRFWSMYLVALIPFALVNGILTSFPVVWYNDSENLGIRLGSIPADDLAYNLFMLMMVTILYEVFRRNTRRNRQISAQG